MHPLRLPHIVRPPQPPQPPHPPQPQHPPHEPQPPQPHPPQPHPPQPHPPQPPQPTPQFVFMLMGNLQAYEIISLYEYIYLRTWLMKNNKILILLEL